MKLYDKKLRPIQPGDVLKVFHFIGARNKKYYMYKLVVEFNGQLKGVCISQLAKKSKEEAHSYFLKYEAKNNQHGILEDSEIIDCDQYPGFEDREKLKL